MDNPNTTPETNPNRLAVESIGSDFTVPSYTPEDPADAARIRQLLDEAYANPLAAPSPVSVTGGSNVRIPERFTASALSSEQRAAVGAKLVNVPAHMRAEREHQAVMEVMQANALQLRTRSGLGAGATPLQREVFSIAHDIAELERQLDEAGAQLNEIARYELVYDEISGKPSIDPDTGQQYATPIHKAQGERRKGLEQQRAELVYRLGLLRGVEGDRRRQRAARPS